jgi:hypothetical protein
VSEKAGQGRYFPEMTLAVLGLVAYGGAGRLKWLRKVSLVVLTPYGLAVLLLVAVFMVGPMMEAAAQTATTTVTTTVTSTSYVTSTAHDHANRLHRNHHGDQHNNRDDNGHLDGLRHDNDGPDHIRNLHGHSDFNSLHNDGRAPTTRQGTRPQQSHWTSTWSTTTITSTTTRYDYTTSTITSTITSKKTCTRCGPFCGGSSQSCDCVYEGSYPC